MSRTAELIESELNTAILKQDKEAVKRFSLIVSQKMDKVDALEHENSNIKSDIKTLAEIMKQGFEEMNKRFENVDKRFEDMNKRFDMMFKFMSLGFTVITILIVFKFLK